MELIFGDDVVFCDSDVERLKNLSASDIDEIRERALQNVLANHTYQKRWEAILDSIGFEYQEAKQQITCAVQIDCREDVVNSLVWFQREAEPENDKLLIVAAAWMDPRVIRETFDEFSGLKIGMTSQSHAHNYAIDGRYAPLESDTVMMCNAKRLPANGWLRNARLHLQYVVDVPIAPASAETEKYDTSSVGEDEPILLSLNTLKVFAASDASRRYVYRV